MAKCDTCKALEATALIITGKTGGNCPHEYGQLCSAPVRLGETGLRAIRGRLTAEINGLNLRVDTFKIVRRVFSLKGSRQRVYNDFNHLLLQKGII